MQLSSCNSLWQRIAASGLSPRRFLSDANGRVALSELDGGTTLDADIETLRGRSVLIIANRQLSAALAMVELDGIARRVILCPPDLAACHLPTVIAQAEVDAVVSDGSGQVTGVTHNARVVRCGAGVVHAGIYPIRDRKSEWLLFTSGTTGQPKIVVHTLASLTGAMEDASVAAKGAVWSTFYDIRRYGGLQILMRALLGGGSIVLSDSRESVGDFLIRAAGERVTHISGTPSHWRRALMSSSAVEISPAYIRLSGEIADQTILNSLSQTFPAADIAHAFASTEAGVAFDVRDGLAGFPMALLDRKGGKVELKVQDGSLLIRSARTASHYAGQQTNKLGDQEGFVDTGDMVECRDGRCYFVGRREGIINVGGLKVHPEEVEAVVNRHPAVQMSRVKARSSPITGALVVADVVVKPCYSAQALPFKTMKAQILDICRRELPSHKVPVTLHQVPSLDIAASGKLLRHHA